MSKQLITIEDRNPKGWALFLHRVSQEDGRGQSDEERYHSIREAREKAEAWEKSQRGEGALNQFILDEDSSGSDLRYNEVVKAAVARVHDPEDPVDTLVFQNISRLGRDVRAGLELLDSVFDNGGKVVTVEENFDLSGTMGRTMFTMLMAMHESMVRIIWEKMIGVHKRNVNDGIVKTAPFGYRKRTEAGTHNGEPRPSGSLVIRKEEAKWVREMFRLAREGRGDRYIADWLNTHGVKTKEFFNSDGQRTSGGNPWTRQAVRCVLSNRTYLGEVSHQYGARKQRNTEKWERLKKFGTITATDRHDAIVTEDQFLRAQLAARTNKTAKHGKRTEREYLLRGVIRCAECRGAMSGCRSGGKQEQWQYRCEGERPWMPNGKCPMPATIECHLADSYAIDEFLRVTAEVQQGKLVAGGADPADVADLQAQISELEGKLAKHKANDDAYDDDYAAWKDRKDRYEARIAEKRGRLSELLMGDAAIELSALDNFSDWEIDKQRMALSQVIGAVFIRSAYTAPMGAAGRRRRKRNERVLAVSRADLAGMILPARGRGVNQSVPPIPAHLFGDEDEGDTMLITGQAA